MDAHTQQLEQLLRRAHVYIGRVASIGAQELSGEILAALNSTRCDCGDPLCLKGAQPFSEGSKPTLATSTELVPLPPEIPNQLLGQIIDQVFDCALEDATVVIDIYRVIASHYGVPRQ